MATPASRNSTRALRAGPPTSSRSPAGRTCGAGSSTCTRALPGEALARIGALFEIERTIAGQSAEWRRAVRQSLARQKLNELAAWLDEQLHLLSGKSELAGAIRYARSRWDALTAYIDDGRLEISNNAAENAIRPVALRPQEVAVRRLRQWRGARRPTCATCSHASASTPLIVWTNYCPGLGRYAQPLPGWRA